MSVEEGRLIERLLQYSKQDIMNTGLEYSDLGYISQHAPLKNPKQLKAIITKDSKLGNKILPQTSRSYLGETLLVCIHVQKRKKKNSSWHGNYSGWQNTNQQISLFFPIGKFCL